MRPSVSVNFRAKPDLADIYPKTARRITVRAKVQTVRAWDLPSLLWVAVPTTLKHRAFANPCNQRTRR